MENCTCYPTGGYYTDTGSSGDPTTSHVNALVTLNGIPYLVAEYIDNRTFDQVDREMVKSELVVDNSECTRTIIDLSVDDIGKDSEGYLNTIGNSTKQQDIVDILKDRAHQMHHKLPVLKKGIIVRIHYRLENQRTGMVMRSMVEDLRIFDRNYFLDINADKLSDTAIVTNYSNSIVSTVAQFTHGVDPMILRITNAQLLYECILPNPMVPRVTNSLVQDPSLTNYFYGCDYDMYQMHYNLQHQHVFNDSMSSGNTFESICPPTWDMFSRFYHFDNERHDIVLHDEEISDIHNEVMLIPCGYLNINRAFVINPGTRIIWKISIWKNDLTMFKDCSDIAAALGCPLTGGGSSSGSGSGSTNNPNCGCGGNGTTNNTYPPSTDPNCNCQPGTSTNQSCIDQQQSDAINKLGTRVDRLINVLSALHPDSQELNKLKFESNVHGDPVAALIDRVDNIARHLDRLEGKIDDTVDNEYITALVSEVQSALDGNPPIYGSVSVMDDGDLSKIEQDNIGNVYITYQNKDMRYMQIDDPDSPTGKSVGWWARVRVNAPESLTQYSDFVNCKMRVSQSDGTWKDINFWERQNSNKDQTVCQRFIDVNMLVDPDKLMRAVAAKEPLQYEIQLDYNSNGAYENRIYVNIIPSRVTLYDQAGNLVWPRIG